MTDFVLKITGSVLNMTEFVLNMIGFVPDMTGLVLNMPVFVPNMIGLVFNMTGFVLNFTGFVLNMTGKLGKVLLKRFDRKFLKTLKKCNVEVDVYGIYVDDIMTGPASIDPGVEFKDGKMVFSQDKVEEDLGFLQMRGPSGSS